MKTPSGMGKLLAKDRKDRIIERYLKEKFKANYNPLWLNTPDNYTQLATAIDFFYDLDDENLAVTAIGSDNPETRETHQLQYLKLVGLLDKFVAFSADTPPVATTFNEKDATLAGIFIKQSVAGRSLRDLHAQATNLGVAEKLLNGQLGQSEWLSEVDLERLLIKLGVKDRVHITRLNADDIGMILHFEREKHGANPAPYSIPLMINCGNNESLGGQGSHWTEVLIRVDPTAGTVNVDYHDSMPADPGAQAILTNAIHYNTTSIVDGHVKNYTAFPAVVHPNLVVRVNSDNSQVDNWSCGYRALHKLLTYAQFPTPVVTPAWTAFTTALYQSGALRDAIYRLLLDGLQINQDFFAAMQLDKSAFKTLEKGKNYGIDEDFAEQYIKFLATSKSTASSISSEQFTKEYKAIIADLTTRKFDPEPKKIVAQLQENLNKIAKSTSSSDAKIFALLEAFGAAYHAMADTRGASAQAAQINKFCEEQFGVTVSKGPNYHFKKDGLILRMMTQLGKKSEDVVLPPPKTVTPEATKISISAPIISSPKVELPSKVSASVNSISTKADPTQAKLLARQTLSRVGTMFNPTQFCYGHKPSGVEPGFRAIDLDEAFFEQLQKFSVPPELTGDEADALKILSATLIKIDKELPIDASEDVRLAALSQKQRAFGTFINTLVPTPHDPDRLSPTISWLCEQIKDSIKENKQLSAWLYKLDYAESGAAKERVKANKEALREYVGTHLARIFSDKNQNQKIVWLKGPGGPHALLACGWKNGLRELTDFLHGGGEPDYNGILVEDPKAAVKHGKSLPGLGRNLIFCLAIGDRDGIGKDGQNKGFADGFFYGFDYGKPYEGDGVCGTLQDDFSFTNPGASAPAFLRGSSKIGLARHIMYRNYSIFYDTDLSERMIGVHLMRKMITGENPSEEVIKSYPGLRQELYRIQTNTPTAEELLSRLAVLRSQGKEGGNLQGLIDNLSMQISTGKLRTFDLYFAEIKINLIEAAFNTGMDFKELTDYLKLLDKWSGKAAVSNQQILNVFEQRLSLTKDEITFLDRLEKIVSPTTVMFDSKTFLNQMQIRKPDERVPFQLEKLPNGNYALTTTNKTVREFLKTQLSLNFNITTKGLSCELTPSALALLMVEVGKQYEVKRQTALAEPIFELVTLPKLKVSVQGETLVKLNTLLKGSSPEQTGILEYLWQPDSTLSLRLTAKTEAQARLLQEIFGLSRLPVLNTGEIINITAKQLQACQQTVNKIYQRELDPTAVSTPSSKWETFHATRSSKEETTSEIIRREEELQHLMTTLIDRFAAINTIDKPVLALLSNAIQEMTLPQVKELLSYKDKTLADRGNIRHIINDELDQICIVDEGIELQSIGPKRVDDQTKGFTF
ncbi:hypothetical protein [Legionella hackeliae]|uniref:Uncharacterized protein n=1 Tax=Legionella hackeliae TaxID=449 RepID=A0A0A8USU2_LEGHA|nr:hypothetical protein [Legionella hackeliae]CEK11940.1 conserved protein of unknown function [Legionella hackeliae]STX48714.1 Uncharacterised protein [Legionella hackeliae]